MADDPKFPANERERRVYEYFMSGETRGDLYAHVKRGKLGISKPPRSVSNAYAAWMAGHDLAAKEQEQSA